MFDEADYLKIMQFLKDNDEYTSIQSGDDIPIELLSQSTFLYDDNSQTLKNLLNFDEQNSLSQDELGLAQTALLSKVRSKKFFKTVLDQVAFNTDDWNQAKSMIIDWYSANNTFVDVMRQANDPFSLPDDHLDLAIKGFGAEIVNKHSVPDRYKRALFLLALVNLYKIKGSPESVYKGLSFIDYHNAQIREWWVKRHPEKSKDPYQWLLYEGRPVKRGQFFNEYTEQY